MKFRRIAFLIVITFYLTSSTAYWKNLALGTLPKVMAEENTDINKDTDTNISSKVYIVDVVKKTIGNIPFSTTVPVLLNHLISAEGTRLKVYREDGKVQLIAGRIKTGMIVTCTAKDGTIISKFSLVVNKNTDVAISSNKYFIDGTKAEIKRIPYRTAVQSMVQNIKFPEGATFKVLQIDGQPVEAKGIILTGMKLEVTAEDGSTKKVYTIITDKNKDATVTSSRYSVSQRTLIIRNVAEKTLLSVFMSHIQAAAGAKCAVYQSNEKTVVTTGYIVSGMKLIVTAEDGRTKNIYTIVVNHK